MREWLTMANDGIVSLHTAIANWDGTLPLFRAPASVTPCRGDAAQ